MLENENQSRHDAPVRQPCALRGSRLQIQQRSVANRQYTMSEDDIETEIAEVRAARRR